MVADQRSHQQLQLQQPISPGTQSPRPDKKRLAREKYAQRQSKRLCREITQEVLNNLMPLLNASGDHTTAANLGLHSLNNQDSALQVHCPAPDSPSSQFGPVAPPGGDKSLNQSTALEQCPDHSPARQSIQPLQLAVPQLYGAMLLKQNLSI